MRYVLYFAAGASLVFWLLWVNLNVLHHQLQRRRGARRVLVALLFYLLLPVGYVVDVGYNKTIAALLFLDWGRELTLSARLKRYIAFPNGWRTRFAVWIARRLVEPWQPGHIGLERFGYPPVPNRLVRFVRRFRLFLP